MLFREYRTSGTFGIHSSKRCSLNVRFTPKATQLLRRHEMTRWAMCGRLRAVKVLLHVAALVVAAMCSAFERGSTGPLAIMPSADQVPVKSSHSTMLWPKWVVLITGSTGSALPAVSPFQPSHHAITGAISSEVALP
jgi:hypothetical protein